MQEAAIYVSKLVDTKITTIVCPWGDKGACVLEDGSEKPFTCEAYQPEKAVDTLGAGDTFFSSFIFAKGQLRKSANEALKFACFVAGIKCGMVGYDGLGERVKNAINSKEFGLDF